MVNEDIIKLIVEKVMDNMGDYLKANLEIPIEVSGRHVHLSKEHMEHFFPDEGELKVIKELSQPGQFQYDKRVTLIGPKGVIQNVAILGPARSETQVEISFTDARILGITPPIRESGKLENSTGIVIAAEGKVVQINQGVIVAKRHIHMTPKDAEEFAVKDGQHVKVKIKSKRPVVLEDVLVRVSPKYRLSMHIDYDEGNAAGYERGTKGEICTVSSKDNLRHKSGEVIEEVEKKIILDNKLITEELLKKLDFQSRKLLYITSKAIVTPMAKDYIRSKNIQLVVME